MVYTIIHQEGIPWGVNLRIYTREAIPRVINFTIYTREAIPRVYNGGYTSGCTTVGISLGVQGWF